MISTDWEWLYTERPDFYALIELQKAEIERLRQALEEIADAPDRHPDGDWSASSLIEIARQALMSSK